MKHHLSICDGKWWVSIPLFYSNQYLKWLFTLWIHYREEHQQQQPCEDSADDSGSSEEEDSDWFVHLFCFIYI